MPLALGVPLALLVAALSPMAIRYMEIASSERALSDSRMLGRAILRFHLDTGVWPVNADEDPETGELSRLVGLPAQTIAPEHMPGGVGQAAAWREDLGHGVGSLEDHLVYNRGAGHARLYPESTATPDVPGWNGPYVKGVPLDPWGHPYVCNTRYLEDARVPGVGFDEVTTHAVFCLSAGPDGVFETPLADDVALLEPSGDDVGWPVQMVTLP